MKLISVALLAFALSLLLTPTATGDDYPVLNGKIAFKSDRDDPQGDVFIMNTDGSGITNLTPSPPGGDHEPAWSPDGSQIAFSSSEKGDSEIFLMSATGSGRTNLTKTPGTDERAAWSPDGTQIVFETLRHGNGREIYVMDVDGGNQTRLTDNLAGDFNPDWSPDGTKIIFHSDRGGDRDIYIMNPDGSGQVPLKDTATEDLKPAWSPDGSKIVFARSLFDGDPNAEIYVMDLDGKNQSKCNDAATDSEPDWSPDGSKILFQSNRDGNTEIWVMNADCSGPAQLTDINVGDTVVPHWQPLGPVGGIAELPDASRVRAEASESSEVSGNALLAVIALAGAVVMGAASWYTWRRTTN